MSGRRPVVVDSGYAARIGNRSRGAGHYNGAYAANKAFQIVLGETLWYELKVTGVDVLVVIGGLMNTQGDTFAKLPRLMVRPGVLKRGHAFEPVGPQP